MNRSATATLLALGLAGCGSANAQQQETPYWATVDTTELNLRVGPSTEYKIDWVYRREGLPLKVLRVKEDGWRFVQDHEGATGWVNKNLLSPDRGGLVIGEGTAPMRAAPADNSSLKWSLTPGVVGELGECEAGWCSFKVGQREGFVAANRLWGTGEP